MNFQRMVGNIRSSKRLTTLIKSTLVVTGAMLLLGACGGLEAGSPTPIKVNSLVVSSANDGSKQTPLAGATLSGTAHITLTGNSNLSEVSFYLNTAATASNVDITAPFDWLLDTLELENGVHTLVALTPIGKQGQSTEVLARATFTINNQLDVVSPEPKDPPSEGPEPRPEPRVTPFTPVAETTPVQNSGDAADDPAIWVNPTDSSLSVIIGTDKKGGLAVYDLAGEQLQYLADGNINNVDVRYNFPLGSERVALVIASNRSSRSIAVYRIDPVTRRLQNAAARVIPLSFDEPYGACMYQSPVSGRYYAFINSKIGEVEQWELFDAGGGQVDAKRVRSFSVGSQTEGCVADDELRHLYIGEERQGIWKYGAEPAAGNSRTLVDTSGPGGHLTADVEGLALYYGENGRGYLIASSQGNNEYVIYEREGDNSYVMRFNIIAGNGIDGVSDTDGIDVVSTPLGSAFPYGLFVAQDGSNDNGNQNFKLVPWQAIMPTK